MKGSITYSATKTIGQEKCKKPRKPWITTEMVEKMEERRMWKHVDTDEGRKKYKSLNNQLRRVTDKAKEKWWTEQCEELEMLERNGKIDLMYRRASQLTGARKLNCQSTQILNKDGRVLTEAAQVQERSKECIEELYDKNNEPSDEDIRLDNGGQEEEQGPTLLYDEFEVALADFKVWESSRNGQKTHRIIECTKQKR